MNFRRELKDLKIKLRISLRKCDYVFYERIGFLSKKYNAIRVAYHRDGENLGEYLLRFLNSDEDEIKSKINSGKIHVNFRRKNHLYKVIRDDLILVDRCIKLKEHKISDRTFKILKETEEYIIVDKPAGIKVHSNNPDGEDSVLECMKKKGKIETPGYIYYESNIVHRLDKNTSGPMIIAKKQKYTPILKRLFKKRRIRKYYFAIAHGKFIAERGVIDFPLLRGYDSLYGDYMIISDKPYKWAKTVYNVIDNRRDLSLVKLKIITGRTHQIRVHLSALGHPVCGDSFYSVYRDKRYPRQMLHSYLLAFKDPFTKEDVKIISPLPEDIRNILKEVYYESV